MHFREKMQIVQFTLAGILFPPLLDSFCPYTLLTKLTFGPWSSNQKAGWAIMHVSRVGIMPEEKWHQNHTVNGSVTAWVWVMINWSHLSCVPPALCWGCRAAPAPRRSRVGGCWCPPGPRCRGAVECVACWPLAETPRSSWKHPWTAGASA